MSDSAFARALGGAPSTVLVRLAAASLLVGALLSWLGLDALDLARELWRGLAHLYGSGFAALRGLGGTALAGAAVVVPAWLVLRVLSYRGPRRRPDPAAPRWGEAERLRD